MATSMSTQNLKRARPGNFSQEHRLDKQIKSNRQVSLTHRTLRELNRQNKTQPSPRATAPAFFATDIIHFARHGGPDLCHLRGYPEPKSATASLSSGRTKSKKSRVMNGSPETRPSSAYDDDFEELMIDNGVYPEDYDDPSDCLTSEPENLDQLRSELLLLRDDLSQSQFPDSAFRDFRKKTKAVCSNNDIMYRAIPTIAGNSTIKSCRQLPFSNIESISEGTTAETRAVPDFVDGAFPRDLSRAIRDELSHLIIPSNNPRAPIVTNFFLEAKGPRGDADVALLQAMHDGAIGARAMLALQNYSTPAPIYDGKAYTISSTYHSPTSTLQLYAHHVTPPTMTGGRPEYHMTKLRGFCMTDCRETFVQGATAFRNAREIAQRYRDAFIQAANAREKEFQET